MTERNDSQSNEIANQQDNSIILEQYSNEEAIIPFETAYQEIDSSAEWSDKNSDIVGENSDTH